MDPGRHIDSHLTLISRLPTINLRYEDSRSYSYREFYPTRRLFKSIDYDPVS